MALNKTGLRTEIEAILNTLKDYDGTAGKTQADAITKFASDLADAIDTYVKTATITMSQAQITTAGMIATPTPVTVTTPVNSTIS